MRWLLDLVFLPLAWSAYFPAVDPQTTWQEPLLQPWDELRATHATVTVTWTPAWNPWCAVGHYELEYRRPIGHPLLFHDFEALQHREADPEDLSWPGDDMWSDWSLVYTGRSRAYSQRIEPGTAHAVEFRVRACGTQVSHDGCSQWSPRRIVHTILDAAQDKINIFIRGTGKNAADYNEIVVDHYTIYRRRDETGLVMAIFSRLDLSLQWLQTYDTHRDRDQAIQMSEDIRKFNQSHFVMVVSTIAWEWHAAQSLVKTMEYCGAHHFGQWAHVFAEQRHYASDSSDLEQTASQDEFGHPYAFIGVPGTGAGMGWESLTYNTGHYEPRNLHAPHAIVRAIAYYDYVARVYRLQDVVTNKADLYVKNSPPATETYHNPYPHGTVIAANHDIALMLPKYKPYIGTMQNHIIKVIEANESVEPYNYVFVLKTVANMIKVDPRPDSYKITEIERIWKNQSARYWPNNGSLFMPGVHFSERDCADFIFHGHTEASPESCGHNFTNCCDQVDERGFIAVECGVGVAPTLCKSTTITQIQNQSVTWPLKAKWPYPFNVINWTE